jgi:hypothetical protein
MNGQMFKHSEATQSRPEIKAPAGEACEEGVRDAPAVEFGHRVPKPHQCFVMIHSSVVEHDAFGLGVAEIVERDPTIAIGPPPGR